MKSEPYDSEKEQYDDETSYFLRLHVKNVGINPATNAVGRLIALYDENWEQVKTIDPINLYWIHYNRNTGFKPVTILGKGDIQYLDVANYRDGKLHFRVALPEGERLPRNDDYYSQGSHPHGEEFETISYFAYIAIYSETEAHVKPDWYWIKKDEGNSEEPYSIEYVDELPEVIREKYPSGRLEERERARFDY
jgi:hypothetical protein